MAGEDPRRTPPLRAFLTGQPFTPRQGPPAPEPPPPPPTWLDRVFDVARGATVGTDWSRPAREESGAALLGELLAAVPVVGGVRKGVQGIRAFHGSPYDFDVFDFSKIGTGQGAQSYGHGLYFAEAEPVALDMRHQLAPRPPVFVGGEEVRSGPPHLDQLFDPLFAQKDADHTVAARIASKMHQQRGIGRPIAVEDALMHIDAELENGIRLAVERRDEKLFNSLSDQRLALQRMRERGVQVPQTGHMYEVNLRVSPEELLDWDWTLKGQPEAIQRLGSERGWDPSVTGAHIYRELGRPSLAEATTLRDFTHRSDPVVASAELRRRGVPGLRYLDQHSRNLPLDLIDTETRNIVMFDDRLIDILRKYGLLLPAAGLGAAAARDSLGTPPPVLAPPPTR